MKITCSGCQTNLKVDDSLVGKKAKCPKCGTIIQIPEAAPAHGESGGDPATEPQKEYAQALGIDFPPSIAKREMTKLISQAVAERDEERDEKREQLSDRESRVREEMRQELLAEIDEEDCRLSKATSSQMVEELANRVQGAILICFNIDDVDFDDLAGAELGVDFSDNLTQNEMERVLLALGVQLAKRLGS